MRMLVCRFKLFELVIAEWILIGCQCLYRSSAGKNRSEGIPMISVPLSLELWCGLCYSLILRMILELYLYRYLYSYCPWCEQALTAASKLIK